MVFIFHLQSTREEILFHIHLEQALNAHGLICGGTGSGKSSLLHMLISSIVMNYTPEDVEIWLSDYKITEFYSYKTNTPPHIRFIGLSKTSDFSYAFLDKIIDEMNRRQTIIAQADYDYKAGGLVKAILLHLVITGKYMARTP